MSSFETVNFKTSPSSTVRLNKPGKPMKVLTLRGKGDGGKIKLGPHSMKGLQTDQPRRPPAKL